MRTYGTPSQLVGLAIVRLVVARLAIAHHGHYVGEGRAGAVILVRVEEDTQTFKVIRGPKDGALRRALLGEPHGKPVTVQISLAMDIELDLDLQPVSTLSCPAGRSRATHLPIGRGERDARENPPLLRRTIGRETNISGLVSTTCGRVSRR